MSLANLLFGCLKGLFYRQASAVHYQALTNRIEMNSDVKNRRSKSRLLSMQPKREMPPRYVFVAVLMNIPALHDVGCTEAESDAIKSFTSLS
jgi:hypothetical protein